MRFLRARLVQRFVPGLGLLLAGFFFQIPEAASHAFGVRYDLPLPLWLYMTGAGASVALSFVVMAIFMRRAAAPESAWAFDLGRWPPTAWLLHPALQSVLQVASVAVFLLILATGLFGEQSATGNFGPTFVWIIWWVGLAFLQALLGDLWAVVNPWSALFDWAQGLLARLRPGQRLSVELPYPAWLGYWPAVILFWAFAWFELVPDASARPRGLALAILLYSLITWAGMRLYGRDVWLRHGEAFSVAFGLLARFAPLAGSQGRLVLRPYGVGLLTDRPIPHSQAVFVVLMLATVTFDGLTETPTWRALLDWLLIDQTSRPLQLALQSAGLAFLDVFMTAALLILPALFLSAYMLFSALTAGAAGQGATTRDAAGAFVLTLVPIAIAYHLAHYVSYLFLSGQLIIPLMSDPFGWGWDLFGTAHYSMDITVITAKEVWYIAATAIVVGHIYAVYLAHVMALRLYGGALRGLRSQVPMLALMIGYTMISLWILSQPIVE